MPPSPNGTLYAEFDPNAYSPDGPLPVAYADYVFDSANAFVEGMGEIGIPYNPELNNGTNVGAKREPFTSDGFRRASSYDAYYVPAENRTNLHVATRAQVQSIIVKQNLNGSLSATGVVYNDIASGMTINVSANHEVILSAGAIQTSPGFDVVGKCRAKERNLDGMIQLSLSMIGTGYRTQERAGQGRHSLAARDCQYRTAVRPARCNI